MISKITILLLLFWTAHCNARRTTSFSASKPHDEEKDVAEEQLGDAELEEAYDDVMDGLTDRPPENEIRKHFPENAEPTKNAGDEEEDVSDAGKKAADLDKAVPEEETNAERRKGKSDKDDKSPNLRDYSFYLLGETSAYIEQIRRAMDKAFRRTVKKALDQKGTYVNETDDEVDVKGHKYHVHKSIIQANDSDSKVLIEAIETDAEPDRKKRSNWFAEEANNAKSTDP